jgi:DNA polymerase III delta prime subunit
MGMQANTVYNMLLNAIKQAHDNFGENNIDGYKFSGAQSNQNVMYDRLMKRFAPNLITWSRSIFLKPETVQKLKDKNPDLINQINDHIHQSTSEREMKIQQNKQDKNLQRSRRRKQP